MMPLIAWMVRSIAGRSRYGPDSPKPVPLPYTSRGFSLRSTSQPRPRRFITPAAKFSTITSAFLARLRKIALPSACFRSSTTDSLLVLSITSGYGLHLSLAAADDVALGAFDLEHAGPHEAEQQAAVGPVVDLAEVEHEHALERAADRGRHDFGAP
jgi:hypothetical protein